MSMTHVIGVDPGLVHTGIVSLLFNPLVGRVEVWTYAVNGIDIPEIQKHIKEVCQAMGTDYPHIFIEAYRPRSHLSTDARMVEGVRDVQRALKGSTVLQNTGVKKVVREDLMKLLRVWKFDTVTNHQDLRSAARIALLGMLKDPVMNELLADLVRDHLDGRHWHVAG